MERTITYLNRYGPSLAFQELTLSGSATRRPMSYYALLHVSESLFTTKALCFLLYASISKFGVSASN